MTKLRYTRYRVWGCEPTCVRARLRKAVSAQDTHDKLEYQVEERLVLVVGRSFEPEEAQLDDVGVVDGAHDLQLAVLREATRRREYESAWRLEMGQVAKPHAP